MQRLLLLRVCGIPRPLTLSYYWGKKLKYACAKALLRMPESKKERITREIQKSLALAGSLFLWKKRHHANLRYVGNRFIPFRVDLTRINSNVTKNLSLLCTIRGVRRELIVECCVMRHVTRETRYRHTSLRR